MKYLSSVAAILCLASCAGQQAGTRSSGSTDGPLVVLSRTESMHNDMGSMGNKTRIDADGQVWTERDGSMVRCQRIAAGQLVTLRAAVRKALAARPKPVYNTSDQPGPNANYSVFETLELELGNQHARVRIKGWADVPAEISAVQEQVAKAVRGCVRKAP